MTTTSSVIFAADADIERRGLLETLGVVPFRVPASAKGIALSRDASTLALGAGNGAVLVDAQRGETRAFARFAPPSINLERCAFSADGVLLFVAGWCNTVFVRDARTLGEVRSFDVGSRHVQALVACPGANLLFTGGFEQHAKLWDSHTGRIVCELPFWEHLENERGAYVHQAVFSPDGTKLVTVTYHGADLWEIPSGAHLAHLADAAFCPAGAAFSADGEDLFVANNVGRIMLVNPRTGGVELERDVITSRRSIHAMATTLDGENLICGVEDGGVYVLTTSTLKVVHRVEVGGLGTSLALGADGDTVFVSDDRGAVVRVSISEGTSERPKLSGPVQALSFEDADTVVSLHQGGSLARYELRSGTFDARLVGAQWYGSLSPRGRVLVAPRSDYSGTVSIIDTRTGELVGSFSGTNGTSHVPDDRRNVVSATERGVLYGGDSRGRIEAPAVRQHASVAVSASGAWFVARSNAEVTRFDAASRTALDVAKTSRGDGLAVDDRGRVTVGAGAKFIVLGDEASGEAPVTIKLERETVRSVACSDDGTLVAAVTFEGRCALYRRGDARGAVVFRAGGSALARVAFSPDGSRFAVGGDDPWLLVYDTAALFAALDAERPAPKKPSSKSSSSSPSEGPSDGAKSAKSAEKSSPKKSASKPSATAKSAKKSKTT